MWRNTNLHTKVEEYRFCTPLQRMKNLYTFTDDYKFVHLCRVIQICTPRWKSTDFVHPYRGLKICIPSQRITNSYTFTEDYKFVHLCKGLQICVPWCLHTRLLTGVHWITAMGYHSNHYWGHLRLATLLQCNVITIQENQWLGTALKFLIRTSKYHGW